MSNEEQKRMAYELTLEYIKQNHLLEGNMQTIPSSIKLIEEAYNAIYQNLNGKRIL